MLSLGGMPASDSAGWFRIRRDATRRARRTPIQRGAVPARSGTGVGPRPAALVPPGALGRPAAAAHVLHGLGVPARFRLDVRPADVRKTGQPGPAQREPTDRLVAPALPR